MAQPKASDPLALAGGQRTELAVLADGHEVKTPSVTFSGAFPRPRPLAQVSILTLTEVSPVSTAEQKQLTSSPTATGRRKRIASIATVTTRPPARSAAKEPPARCIRDSVQPPKTLPPALASAGMAMVRSCGPPGTSGSWSAILVSPSPNRRRSGPAAVNRAGSAAVPPPMFRAAAAKARVTPRLEPRDRLTGRRPGMGPGRPGPPPVDLRAGSPAP